MTPEENLKVKSLADPAGVFNHVIEHLQKQGVKSLHPHPRGCAYRGRNETMCAVGSLIANDEYDPLWEGKSIDSLLEEDQLPPDLKKRIEPNLAMLIDLQQFHDLRLEYCAGRFTNLTEIRVNSLRSKWNIE